MTSLPYTNIQKGPINLNVYQDENEKAMAKQRTHEKDLKIL